MGDIEQTGFLPRMQMFFQYARGILHGHFIARERHHLAAQFEMQRMERRVAENVFGGCHDSP